MIKRIFAAMVDARQREANKKIAEYLSRTEFRDAGYDVVLAALNEGHGIEGIRQYAGV